MEEGGGTGGAALVAVEAAAPREEFTVKIYKDKLHCPVCTLPFKFPIFQCEAGHSACSSCHAQVPKDRCYACGRDGAYRRNTTLEDVVGGHRIPCPYGEYGCRTDVTYHAAGDHQLECPCAPCRCSEPGCAFVSSPPMLRDHLAPALQSWPVDKISYGDATTFGLPASLPRRLLVAEDGRVCLVSSCAMGPSYRGGGAQVHVLYVGDRAQIRVVWPGGGRHGSDDGGAEQLGPGEATAEEAVRLVVRNKNLHGASMEMRLWVRIENVPA